MWNGTGIDEAGVDRPGIDGAGEDGTGRDTAEGRLAVRVLEACRNQLFFRQRFLEQALFRLEWLETGSISFGSDGKYLYYNNKYILKRYMESTSQMALDYLHTVLHCLYQHPFFCPQGCTKEQEMCWNLAADMAVEAVLVEMAEFGNLDGMSRLRSEILQKLKEENGFMPVQKLFVYLQKNAMPGGMIFGMDFQGLCRLFKRDEHGMWHRGNGAGKDAAQKGNAGDAAERGAGKKENAGDATERGAAKKEDVRDATEKGAGKKENAGDAAERGASSAKEAGSRREDMDAGKNIQEDYAVKSQESGDSRQQKIPGRQPAEAGRAGRNGRAGKTCHDRKKLQQLWKNTADRVLMEAQATAYAGRAEIAGTMLLNLKRLARETYDYSLFLMKFAARREEGMQIDEEEFDNAFYAYGLRLFGRVPLIEPLEYKEKRLIREFLIAIDTSGSCQGEIVEGFLAKTYNILRQAQAFTSRVNIHIVQCDTCIQEAARIESQKGLEEYIAHLVLKGFGGTDFRPVFEYTDRLLEKGEIRRLDGLLYFTDGYGIFPSKPPKYKTAFVFLDKAEEVKVPPWAMKVYLDG